MKLTGKNFFRFVPAVLFCTVAVSVFADDVTEQRLGDNAFYAGDYRNAAVFYESAMKLSDAAGKPEAWADNALKLGYARFLDGNTEGARQLLTEFRRRHPGRSAGTLPGDLLAAAGKNQEAEKFYQTLIATGDPETVAAAEMSRGFLKLRLNDYDGAKQCFENVAKTSSPLAKNGRLAMIYTLIRQNKISAAMIELGKIPVADQGEQWKLLRWLIDLRSGRYQEVETPLLQFVSTQSARPQPRICEVLIDAAQAASKLGKTDKAITFYEKAQVFCPDNESRQEIFRRLINLYAKIDPVRASDTAKNYAELFPAAPDRAAILISIGKLLNQNGKDAEALALLQQVVFDRQLALTDRLNAAEIAIGIAEKNNRRDEAEKLYKLLLSESPGVSARFHWRCAYIQYLLRINDVKLAVQTVQNALAGADKNEREILLMLQLEALRNSENTEEISKTAKLLLHSNDPTRAALAHFILAESCEKKGDFVQARKIYLETAALGGEQERSAHFKAAQMAMKCEDHEKTAQEFSDFARRYPKAESTPAALYYAIGAYRKQGAPEPAEELQRKLKELYPRSKARIALEMLNGENRAENGDAAGAANDLGQMISELKGHPDLADAMLMQMRFLLFAEEKEKALNAAKQLNLAYPVSPAAQEALLLAGNIEFNRGNYTDALAYFQQAEIKLQSPLLQEVLSGRIIDTELVLYGSSDPAKLADTQTRCQKLFTTSANPLIRLQSRYKYGMAKERSGDQKGAIAAYEQLLYDAQEMKKQKMPVSTEWCVRAANAALRLIAGKNTPDALQRGLRLIDQYESLNLAGCGENFAQLRRDFRKKIRNKIPRR